MMEDEGVSHGGYSKMQGQQSLTVHSKTCLPLELEEEDKISPLLFSPCYGQEGKGEDDEVFTSLSTMLQWYGLKGGGVCVLFV